MIFMPNSSLRLGTRGSQLALWQAHHIQSLLAPLLHPRTADIVTIETDGDRDQATSLSNMGGYGVFTKAIQSALQNRRVDLAVHSLKDLPTIPVEGLMLVGSPRRAPVGDVLISKKYARFDDLPVGATIGTNSLRRRSQVLNRRPDLNLIPLRGNVDTRLRKLAEQQYDAIILAEAGLVRLNLAEHITEILDPEWMLPAVGQGAIGLECRVEDGETRKLVEAITDRETWQQVLAERAMLAALGGGCLVPIGTTSQVHKGILTLRAAVLSQDGKRRIVATHRGPAETPLAVGQELAGLLLDSGAGEILEPHQTP
jgi:hydroxymethylbilane synthase